MRSKRDVHLTSVLVVFFNLSGELVIYIVSGGVLSELAPQLIIPVNNVSCHGKPRRNASRVVVISAVNNSKRIS